MKHEHDSISRAKKFVRRPLTELSSSGLLWLINRSVFHPRGISLGIMVNKDDDDPKQEEGWFLLGDGTESWHTDINTDDEKYFAACRTIQEQLSPNPFKK